MRKPLRLTARAVLIISVAIQMLFIAVGWLQFDSRPSCDLFPSWSEWIKCLHGMSHPFIMMIEGAVGCWLVAGIAMLLGRFLPPYISVLAPVGVGAAYIYIAIKYLHEQAHFGVFVIGIEAVYILGPFTAAWLFGTLARASELTSKQSRRIAAVFDP
jgi:hypothetical protein